MYPFYKKDLDEGMLTKEQVLTLLKCQWVKHLEISRVPGRCLRQGFFRGIRGRPFHWAAIPPTATMPPTIWNELLNWIPKSPMNNIQPTLALFYTPKMKPVPT